jgi:DNA replication and repair protein RecF
MGLFHVEHSYLKTYAELNRTLKQRNAALKHGDRGGVMAWDPLFLKAATTLDTHRQLFIADLMHAANTLVTDWRLGFSINHRYRQGWRTGAELAGELARKLDFDLTNGFTSVGPQRAEIEILSDGASAEKTLSRGQQKMLVIALNLGIIDLMHQRGRTSPVVLIDDLAAELDRANQQRVLEEIAGRGVQAFVTAIEVPGDKPLIPVGVFHVEHGRLKSGG